MKRLRHPIRAIEEPFGKAGLVVAVIALIAALGGTAFAAAKLNGTQKKEVEKIAKKFAGKPGPAGPAGPAGAAGPKGDAGAAGTNGTNGTNGESVTIATEGECVKFSNKSGSGKACNGEPGPEGTIGATLSPEHTETGSWLATANATNSEQAVISFAIPLAEGLNASHVHYVTRAEEEGGTQPTGCTNGKVEEPIAAPGNLCVYEGTNTQGELGEELPPFILKPGGVFTGGTGTAGAFLSIESKEAGARFTGTFAVTAP